MKFASPLTVRLRSGQVLVADEFNLVITDDAHSRRVVAQLLPVTKPFLLWEGDAYTAAGDYTQAHAEERLREILGENPTAALSVAEPQPYVYPSHP